MIHFFGPDLHYLEKRRKRNLSIAKHAVKMTGDKKYINEHPELLIKTKIIKKPEEDNQDDNIDERILHQEQEQNKNGPDTKITAKKFLDKFFARKKTQKLTLEKDNLENLTAKERSKITQLAHGGNKDVEEQELGDEQDPELESDKKRKKYGQGGKISKEMAMLSRISMHAKRAPGDQAGSFDTKEAAAENFAKGTDTGVKLKHNFEFKGVASEGIGLVAGVKEMLEQQSKDRNMREGNNIGSIVPDAPRFGKSQDAGHSR